MHKTFSVTKEHYTMEAELQIIGRDFLICITGGDTPHIGTVTTYSTSGEQTTTRFESHDGRFHKDDILADTLLASIKDQLTGNCILTSGVHVNAITQAQINVSTIMAKDLGEQIHDWLTTHTIQAETPVYYKKNEKPLS